ncbi:hypothetical protein Fmac_013130 [Flemingia macrophylla]|uniref:CCT domain-containing protein n=1 Tax=Flemingia macrophylla TaxID=520843 RepID=A0ABD1MSA1_9FABA
MSSCLSGAGGRTYGFDFEFVKSPSSSTRTSHTSSSSPSSTISESSNSAALAISTKKPRTPRKRPNQTYNEAAALLSTAYPNLFSTKNLKTHGRGKFTRPTSDYDSSELLLPFRVFDGSSSCFLLDELGPKPTERPKVVSVCESPGEISSAAKLTSLELLNDDVCEESLSLDAESILDEEIEEGMDSIMGGSIVEEEDSKSDVVRNVLMAFEFARPRVRALRQVDHVNWWNFPAVDILQISPKIRPPPPAADKKVKNKKAAEKEKLPPVEFRNGELPKPKQALMLKLNYDDVRSAWSDRGTPFADDSPLAGASESDIAAQIDLWWDNNGGVREASVLRYKEKRRTRLFSKKIRYQVRKVNADRRPRMKVRLSSSSS